MGSEGFEGGGGGGNVEDFDVTGEESRFSAGLKPHIP